MADSVVMAAIERWLDEYFRRGGWYLDHPPNRLRLNPLDYERFADELVRYSRSGIRPRYHEAFYLNTPLGQVEIMRDVWVAQGEMEFCHAFPTVRIE